MNQRMGIRRGTPTVAREADSLLAKADALPTAYEFVLGRALGSGEKVSTTTSSSNVLPITGTLFPSATTSASSGTSHGLSQTALEWLFVVIAVGLLAVLVLWRCTCMRYRNRRLQASMLPDSRSHGRRLPSSYRPRAQNLQYLQPAHIRDSEDITNGSTFNRQSRALVLSPSFLHTGIMPLVDGRGVQINTPNPTQSRVRGQRVTALDVDEGGRRGGSGAGEDGDEDGDLRPGDELPAYEVGKGPPGYQAAIGNTARPDIVEVGLPERTAQSVQRPEESPNTDRSHPQAAPEYASTPLYSRAQNNEPRGFSPPLNSTPQDHPPPPAP